MMADSPTAAESVSPAEHLPSPTEELDRSLVRGIAWTGGVKTVVQAVSWLSTLIVARLLSPTDYGISGMAMVYIGLVQLVNEFGLSAAVVQRRDLTDDQIARLGGLSILLGASLCAVSILSSPLIAAFFGQPAVRMVVIVLSTTFLTSAFQVLPRSLLTRELKFRDLATLEGAEAICGTAATLTLAAAGFGYWSLVVGAVAGRIVSTVMALGMHRHRLAWPFPLATISDSVRFGSHLAVASIAWYVFRSADMTVIGRQLGELPLGAYTLAWTLASLPVDRISSLVARATPSIFARVQDSPVALRRYVVILTEALAFVTAPAAVGLALVADDFVVVVLGPTWRPAIAPLRLLSLAAVFRSTVPILGQVLVATGQSRRNMEGTIGIAIILPLLFLLGSRWGLSGVALVWLLVFPLASYALYMRHALAASNLSPAGYLKALWPAVSAALAMTAAVLMVHQGLLSVRPPLRLAVEVLTGAATYLAVIYIVHRGRLVVFLSTLRALR
jgi:PST family polysaccharide transporter